VPAYLPQKGWQIFNRLNGGKFLKKKKKKKKKKNKKKKKKVVMMMMTIIIMAYEALKSFTQCLLAHMGRIPSLSVSKRTHFHPRPTTTLLRVPTVLSGLKRLHLQHGNSSFWYSRAYKF